ncbi:carboxylesterase family protein [Streptomyces sp. GC420]|nr:carboxylesterase family protein [Streptomyces sp. GC420]
MPHILTAILTKAAVAVLEALLMRLLVQLWNSFARTGHPVAAVA